MDRRREPLNGSEVRACWEDGAVPIPPDPVTPGLLDLLTLVALGDDVAPAAGESSHPTPAALSRSASAPSGGRRLWVEVEA